MKRSPPLLDNCLSYDKRLITMQEITTRYTEAYQFFKAFSSKLLRVSLLLYLPIPILSLLIPQFVSATTPPQNIFILIMFINLLYQPLYWGGIIHYVHSLAQGEEHSFAQLVAVTVSQWGQLFVTFFVSQVIIILGFLALFIPGIFATIRLSLALFAASLKGYPAMQALMYSNRATRPYTAQIFLAIFPIVFGLFSILIILNGLLPHTPTGTFFILCIESVLSIVFYAFMTILLYRFFDLSQKMQPPSSEQ